MHDLTNQVLVHAAVLVCMGNVKFREFSNQIWFIPFYKISISDDHGTNSVSPLLCVSFFSEMIEIENHFDYKKKN